MKSAKPNDKPGHLTKGDIFDDLGFSPADTLEAKIKADIWQALMKHIEQHEFSQAYLVSKLKAHQPDVSNLLKGKISRFSITKLIQFAGRLNLDARVQVASPRSSKKLPSLSASVAKTGRNRREPLNFPKFARFPALASYQTEVRGHAKRGETGEFTQKLNKSLATKWPQLGAPFVF